jgi:response regulator RpfG family c-di-GMP phosphodiesterase
MSSVLSGTGKGYAGSDYDSSHRLHAAAYNPQSWLKDEYMATTKPKRIMVVDDDDTIRKVLEQLFTDLNWQVKTFDDPIKALTLFEKENFELVFSDIQMPGMDGWELTANLKKISPETPVVLITGMDHIRPK